MKALVVGAGPVGSYAAALLSKEFETTMVEEHSVIGSPVQCAGVVSDAIFEFIPRKKELISARVSRIRIHSPSGSLLELDLKKPDIVLDRRAFDHHFFEMALDKGVNTLLGHRFLSRGHGHANVKRLVNNVHRSLECGKLIGADGPQSAVAKESGLYGERRFFTASQVTVKRENDGCIDFYPYEGAFGYAVPQGSGFVNVGVASLKNPQGEFERLLKIHEGEVVDTHSGLVPVYNPKQKFCNDTTYLVGDAGCFTNATSASGIVSGLASARLLARALNRGENYTTLVKKHIEPRLRMHLMLRKKIDRLTEERWDKLVKDLSWQPSRKALERSTRDEPFKLLLRLGLSNPFLARYAF